MQHKKRNVLLEVTALQKDKEIKLLYTLLWAEKKERLRIANELYNSSTSALAAIKMYLNTFQLKDAIGGQESGRQDIVLLLEKTSAELTRTSYSLTSEAVLENGLNEALIRYCNHINKRKLLIIEYDCLGESRRYKEIFELSVYHIFQQLLNCIIKHSLATKAIVQMSERKGLLAITIEDSRDDLDKSDIISEWPELYSLQTRVDALNGQLELRADNGFSAFLQLETYAFEKM